MLDEIRELLNRDVATHGKVQGLASNYLVAELAQLGHEAVVFEKQALAGGLNTYGIAYYKLTPAVSLQEVELVKQAFSLLQSGP